MKEHPTENYLLLEQKPGQKAFVYHVNAQTDAREVMFEGGRVAAKKFLAELAVSIAWENVPQYNRKKGRNGCLVRLN